VKLLAADVRTKVETALPAAALLIPAIESAMQDVAALEEGQTKDLPSVISQVLANLSSFRDIEKQVCDASARLVDQYNAISDAFKKLIVSVQFHDITRQQVEHVIDVLRGLLSESGGASGSISNGQHDTAAVVALQSMQLADAGAKFADSAASVVRNMDDIARHVLEMADESRALSGLSADETTSFLLQMEGICTAILALAKGLERPTQSCAANFVNCAFRRERILVSCMGDDLRGGQDSSEKPFYHGFRPSHV
jgi:hypothetical protein